MLKELFPGSADFTVAILLEDSDFLDLNADTIYWQAWKNCLIKAGRIQYQLLETNEIRDRTKLIFKLNQILGFSVEQ